MSLSTAISNAKSGLFANSKSAEVIAGNVANSMTEGYGKRQVQLTSRSLGGAGNGVQVENIERVVNQYAINERRVVGAAQSYQAEVGDFLSSLERSLGAPGSDFNLADQVSNVEAALIEASVSPENNLKLSAVVTEMQKLTNTLNLSSSIIMESRETADAEIGRTVQLMNSSLQEVASLNSQIRSVVASKGDANGLIDHRQRVIDSISSMIPVKEVPDKFGTVRLLTTNGTTLVATQAAQFTFTATSPITPDMTISSGALSSLSLTGAQSLVGDIQSVISGGALAAQFQIRDELAPLYQSEIDSFARELVDRFSDPSLDGSLAGGAGIFTDTGSLVAPGNLVGLAGRIEVNSALVPLDGGDVWRLRDGVGATAEGPPGASEILTGLMNLFEGNSVDGSATPDRSVISLASEMRAEIAIKRANSEEAQTFHSASLQSILEQELAYSVDTDQELQELLVVENNYAANARLLTAIDEMMQTILRI